MRRVAASFRTKGEQLIGRNTVDDCKHNQFCGRQTPVFPFHAVQPACRDSIRWISPVFGETRTSLFDFTQGKSPFCLITRSLAPIPFISKPPNKKSYMDESPDELLDAEIDTKLRSHYFSLNRMESQTLEQKLAQNR
jgi:hypothetical protein